MNIFKFLKGLFTRKKQETKPETTKPIETGNELINRKLDFKSGYERSRPKETPSYRRPNTGYSNKSRQDDDSSFLTSMVIANATDSTILGTVLGGDPVGAVLGDMMNSSDDHHHSSFDSHDYGTSDFSSSDSSSFDF